MRCLTKKVMTEYKKHFAELDLQHGGKTAGVDMIRRNYITVTLCIAGAAECDRDAPFRRIRRFFILHRCSFNTA